MTVKNIGERNFVRINVTETVPNMISLHATFISDINNKLAK